MVQHTDREHEVEGLRTQRELVETGLDDVRIGNVAEMLICDVDRLRQIHANHDPRATYRRGQRELPHTAAGVEHGSPPDICRVQRFQVAAELGQEARQEAREHSPLRPERTRGGLLWCRKPLRHHPRYAAADRESGPAARTLQRSLEDFVSPRRVGVADEAAAAEQTDEVVEEPGLHEGPRP